MSRNFPVKGLADLDRYLSNLPKNMQKAAYRQALTAAAAPIRDEARALAAGFSSKVAKATKSGSPRQNQDGTFSIRVYVDEKMPDGYIGLFGEYGVAPHLIAAKASKRGRASLKASVSKGEAVSGVMKIGDRFVSGVISHPGHAAHPFLRPALDMKADDAVKAFGGKIRAFLEGKTGFAAPEAEAA